MGKLECRFYIVCHSFIRRSLSWEQTCLLPTTTTRIHLKFTLFKILQAPVVAAPGPRAEENEYLEANEVRQSYRNSSLGNDEYSNSIEPAPPLTEEDKPDSKWNEEDSGYSDQSPTPAPRASQLSDIPENRDSAAISEAPEPEIQPEPEPEPEPKNDPPSSSSSQEGEGIL